MSQMTKVSKNNTTVSHRDGYTTITLHSTDVVKFNEDEVILNSGGWFTATTKARMNQAACEYRLDYHVWQEKGGWYVETKSGDVIPFVDGMTLKR